MYTCLESGETCESKNYPYIDVNGKQCYKTISECESKNGKIIGNICQGGCPENSEDKDNDGICECKYNYYILSLNSYNCLGENEECKDNGHPFKENNGNECYKTQEECINKGKFIFNDECYTQCPENTDDSNNDRFCECKNNYYNPEPNKYTCLGDNESCENNGYPFKDFAGKECFKTALECKNKGKFIFNYECYPQCPPDTNNNNNEDNICSCSFNFYYDSKNDLYTCLTNYEKCENKNYNFEEIDGKECFISLADCISKNKFIFNSQCYKTCPEKTKIKLDDNSLCECENYFFEENNIYNCFSNDKICLTENQDYKYTNIQTKECFKTKNDCLNKNGNTEIYIYNEECEFYIFNNKCFENIPPGTKLINSNSKICQCKENFEIDTSGNKCICKENYKLDENGENCVQKMQ